MSIVETGLGITGTATITLANPAHVGWYWTLSAFGLGQNPVVASMDRHLQPHD